MFDRSKLAPVVAAAALLVGTPAVAQQKTVTLVAYQGIFHDRYAAAVVEPFMKANPDIKVNVFPVASSAVALGNLRAQKAAPQSDVVIMDVSVAKAATDEQLFEKIDEKSVPNIASLYPTARFADVAGVAVTFDNVVLLYNTDTFKEAPKSWKILADPAYKGKVAMPGVPDIVGLSLVMILDKANGGTGPDGKFEKGIEAMAPIAPNVQTWDPKPDIYANVIAGQTPLGVGWNARAQANADSSGGKIAATMPVEGSVFQINTINLVKGSQNPEAAKKFIDYALSPEAQKAFTESMFYAPTNAKAKVSAAAIDRTAVNALDRVIPVDWLAVAKVRDAVTEQWRRRVIPLSR